MRFDGEPAGAQVAGRARSHTCARAQRSIYPTGRMRFDGEIGLHRKTRADGHQIGFSSSGSIFRIAESISAADWTPPETDVIQVECPWNPSGVRDLTRGIPIETAERAPLGPPWYGHGDTPTHRGEQNIFRRPSFVFVTHSCTYISEAALLRSESAVWFGRYVRMNAPEQGVRVEAAPRRAGKKNRRARARRKITRIPNVSVNLYLCVKCVHRRG